MVKERKRFLLQENNEKRVCGRNVLPQDDFACFFRRNKIRNFNFARRIFLVIDLVEK